MLHNILIILAFAVGYLTVGAVLTGILCRLGHGPSDDEKWFPVLIWPVVLVAIIILNILVVPLALVDFIENFKFRHPND